MVIERHCSEELVKLQIWEELMLLLENNETDLTQRAVNKCNSRDFYALRTFWFTTKGWRWSNNVKSGWDLVASNRKCPSGGDLSTMNGIRLHPNGRVKTLSKPIGTGLDGYLHSSLVFLDEITELEVNSSDLSGTIPSSIGDLSELSILDFSSSDLSGGIPFQLGNLSNLGYLNLRNNNLSGCYPTNLQNLCSQIWVHHYSKVNDGNNFNATFASFCNNGAGGC